MGPPVRLLWRGTYVFKDPTSGRAGDQPAHLKIGNFSEMLTNAYLDAKIGVDPAENEPRKE